MTKLQIPMYDGRFVVELNKGFNNKPVNMITKLDIRGYVEYIRTISNADLGKLLNVGTNFAIGHITETKIGIVDLNNKGKAISKKVIDTDMMGSLLCYYDDRMNGYFVA